ncbi:SUKH-4 family immunity protein [Kitasatospora terrestris]|uniref:SUKH-4 immunity protein of toxin-antitoxin system n=1 Tax=Kitasatospora terrestris TaxID=258051 RepID=A0ABP9ESR7_9ACTN
MATHAELTELFGAEGVITLPRGEAAAGGVPDADAQVLAEVGLPAELDVIFSLAAPGAHEAFTLVPIDTGEGIVKVLCLGGPTGSPDMRYCLDLEDGYVILLTLGEQPAAEIVNTTLADFIEFLYRFGLRFQHIAAVDDRQADEYTEQLRKYLEARDPQAFAEDDNWWSMVFDRLLGKEL